MAIIGYARVSTASQKLDSQIDALQKFGIDTLYTEKESGLNQDRPTLALVLRKLKPGDTLVIFKLDRLARSTQHLLQIVDKLASMNVHFVSIQNNIDSTTATGKLLFTIMSAFAEMEATLIKERVKAGLKSARDRGVQLGRPTPFDKIDPAIEKYSNTDVSVMDIVSEFNIAVPTLYSHLNKREIPLRSKCKSAGPSRCSSNF